MRNHPPNENLVLILYVGTRRLSGILAENDAGAVRVLKFSDLPNAPGFQKGAVSEIEKAQESVSELLRALVSAEEALEIPAHVLLSGASLKMERYTSSLYFSGYPRVITSYEVRSVVHQTRQIAPLSLNDWVLQVVPESFWVNDLKGVHSPLGLEGQRLAATAQIYTIDYAVFKNLSRVFENLELNLEGYYPKILTLPDGVLNDSEKEGSVLIVDFSDEATHLVQLHEGEIVQAHSLDIGSRFLTAHVADRWGVSVRDAERLKESFGSLQEGAEFGEELIPLVGKNGEPKTQIKRAEFHEAFYKSGEELFQKIGGEVRKLLDADRARQKQMIVTGGGVKLEGLLDYLGRRFEVPVRLGTPRHVEGSRDLLMDPAWSGLVGLVRWLGGRGRQLPWQVDKGNLFERSYSQLKEWLTAYF